MLTGASVIELWDKRADKQTDKGRARRAADLLDMLLYYYEPVNEGT